VVGHRSKLRQLGSLCRCLLEPLGERGGGEKQGNEIFFFPCLMHSGEEEDPQCRSK